MAISTTAVALCVLSAVGTTSKSIDQPKTIRIVLSCTHNDGAAP